MDEFDTDGRIPFHTNITLDYDEPIGREQQFEVTPLKQANVVSSMTTTGKHKPALDLDIPATLVPSTTEGHSHLYLGIELDHEQYGELIDVLEKVGIIQKGFANQYRRRGATFLRPPWVKKECD